jgi:hypothetical protein
MTDSEFIASFEDCSLAEEKFHHADHVRMAFLYLCRYPALEAIQRFSASLIRFAAALNKSQLYHETITWAFMFLIRERIARAGHRPTWAAFSAANGDLLSWKDNVLKTYYRDETLASELARRVFLLPDRARPDGLPGA